MSIAGVLRLAFTGSVEALASADRDRLFHRASSSDTEVRERTAAIIDRVRTGGDAALRALALELDGVTLTELEVPRQRCRAALDALDADLRRALERAAANIATAHRAALPRAFEVETEPGVTVGRRPDPLARVGIYAPGGRAAYPSSVLMEAVPARVAGVGEIILCTPPETTGLPSPVVLAAAELSQVDRVFALGGAGAIAAMSFGTDSVPRVDRVIGPGNAYVAEAKLQLSGVVGIDSPAGPSELLVIADSTADPVAMAREMIAQAEHDPRAAVVVIALDPRTAARIAEAVAERVEAEPRVAIIAEALASSGAILTARDVAQALDFAREYAPEHLLLATDRLDEVLPLVLNAGAVFVGSSSSVSFGDYMTGGNHVLPTGGLARSYSGLSVLDFVRWTSWQRVTPEAAARLGGDVARIADAERLPAHAAAARAWSEGP
ncbi:MAG TPA: histidinol dehydrogenase [Gemmatimonadaceae bacterium]|nr:histidinol dehydrogenase [Gemmatimonadaceae bacterium]